MSGGRSSQSKMSLTTEPRRTSLPAGGSVLPPKSQSRLGGVRLRVLWSTGRRVTQSAPPHAARISPRIRSSRSASRSPLAAMAGTLSGAPVAAPPRRLKGPPEPLAPGSWLAGWGEVLGGADVEGAVSLALSPVSSPPPHDDARTMMTEQRSTARRGEECLAVHLPKGFKTSSSH